jgi:hypothetical protein
MLVCVFLSTFAHETAGAARTRSSLRPLLRVALRPLLFGAKRICKTRANAVARMRGCVNRDHPSTSSRRRPGPITPGLGCEGRHPPHCRNENTRRMGPSLRRDDDGGWSIAIARSPCDEAKLPRNHPASPRLSRSPPQPGSRPNSLANSDTSRILTAILQLVPACRNPLSPCALRFWSRAPRCR